MSTNLDTSNPRSPGYGLAFGVLLGACLFLVDGTLTAIWGLRIPIAAAPLLAAYYLVGGAVAGAVVATLVRLRSGGETSGVRIQTVLTWSAVAMFVAMFAQRARLGYDAYADGALGYAPVGVGMGVGVLMILVGWGKDTVARDQARRTPLWVPMCAALFCGLWEPFGHLYQAPMLSQKSLIANACYATAAFVVFFLGRPMAGRVWRASRLCSSRSCVTSMVWTIIVGLIVSGGILWSRLPEPMDRPFAPHKTIADVGVSRPPDIVMIVLDTVRADHLSAYGYALDTTPNLSAFAREAVRYDQAVAPSTWTLPSHASMFTGLLPGAHGVHNLLNEEGWYINGLDEEHLTLAEVLSGAGYHTGAILGNSACLSREFGLHQGFDYYDDEPRPSLAAARPRILSAGHWLSNHHRRKVGDWRKGWSRNAEEINTDVFAWLDRGVGAPFFLFVNYIDAHAPYSRHPEYEDKLRPASGSPTPGTVADHAWRYDQELAYTDARIGELMASLKARGRYDNALIIVTADHGEAFGEHDNMGHGNSLYEEEARVPLLVRYPHGATHGTCATPTSLASIPSIIFDHLGMQSPFPSDELAAHGSWAIVAELYRAELVHPDDTEGPVLRSLFGPERFKAIVKSTMESELYDLAVDPLERTNIGHSQSETLLGAIERFAARTAYLTSQQTSPGPSFTMSEELRKRLQSLGYLK